MKLAKRATVDAVAQKFAGRRLEGEDFTDHLEIAGGCIAISTSALKDAPEPRLRFDRVATGFVSGLQGALSAAVPKGKIVLVTVTAPIRKDSKTAAELEDKIRELMAARRAQLDVSIHGNHVRVRVLKSDSATTPKLVGFVHNRAPDPAALVGLVRSLLACVGSGTCDCPRCDHDRWLVLVSEGVHEPGDMLRHVCFALHLPSVFKKILVENRRGEITLLKSLSAL